MIWYVANIQNVPPNIYATTRFTDGTDKFEKLHTFIT